MDERAERAWKWLLRGLGVVGFAFLLITDRDAPVAFYVLLGGLLGLPNIISYQMALNKDNKALAERLAGLEGSGDGEDAEDA